MSIVDIELDLSQAGVGKIIFFNPNREEYKDFRPLWRGREMNNLVSGNFIEMFRTWGWMTWSSDNVDTGRMRAALVSKKGETGGFSNENKLRRYNPKSMEWGVNADAQGFQTDGVPYPYIAAARNPFGFVDQFYIDKIPEIMGDYLVKLMQKMKGL